LAGAWLFSSCGNKELQEVLEPSEALSKVLVEETSRAAGPKKQVAVITHDATWGGPSPVEESFRSRLQKQGFTVFTAKAAVLGDPMRSGEIGLKPADFFEAMEKSSDAGAVVSFAGAPLLKSAEFARLPQNHPPVLIVATSRLGLKLGVRDDPMHLASLLEAKTIQLAIIDGASDSTSAAAGKTDATHQLFSQNYRILRRPD
jgi:hypothetical protein